MCILRLNKDKFWHLIKTVQYYILYHTIRHIVQCPLNVRPVDQLLHITCLFLVTWTAALNLSLTYHPLLSRPLQLLLIGIFQLTKILHLHWWGKGRLWCTTPPSYTVYTGFSAKTVYVGNVQIVTCGNMKLKPVLVLQ